MAPKVWRVVGGSSHGGVVIREGRELTSAKAPSLLSTGALVAEEELVGGQIRFRRLSGEGPCSGWVRLRLGQTVLLVPHVEQQPPLKQKDEGGHRRVEDRPNPQTPPACPTATTQVQHTVAAAGVGKAQKPDAGSTAPAPAGRGPAPAPQPSARATVVGGTNTAAKGAAAALCPRSTQPLSTAERHVARAAELRELLLQVRREGAERFSAGMCELWRAAEALEPPGSLMLARRGRPEDLPSPFCAVADRRLLSFEALASDLRDELRQLTYSSNQLAALRTLLPGLDALLDLPAVAPLESAPLGLPLSVAEVPLPSNARGSSADVRLGPARSVPSGLPVPGLPVPGLGGPRTSCRVLPLVFLPLALYVRNTSHLYAMLERLKSRASSGAAEGATALRAALDADGRKYSYLVFAVAAALQSLLLLRRALGFAQFPHALLASSPPLQGFGITAAGTRNAFPMAASWPEAQLVFRGIWIGREVDEEQAQFQYSFQSFAREVQGMSRVLAFYADVPGSAARQLAEEHSHALVYVFRAEWQDESGLAMPVQVFDGPNRVEDGEYEVMLPPYVRYEFEEDLSFNSEAFQNFEADEKLRKLAQRWGPGFELPELLLRMLKGVWQDSEPALQRLRPSLELRFVRSALLPPPLRELFLERRWQLYDFGGG